MSFAEVSGIVIERDTLSYRHGLSYWEGEVIRSYRSNRYVPVTLRKGVVHGNAALHDWLNADGGEKRSVDIHLCGADGSPRQIDLTFAAGGFHNNFAYFLQGSTIFYQHLHDRICREVITQSLLYRLLSGCIRHGCDCQARLRGSQHHYRLT